MTELAPFSQRVIELIAKIPAGKVCSYGAIAAAAGSPRGARQVVRLLHSTSAKYQLPWHRVVNKQGTIVLKDQDAAADQALRLALEGVLVSHLGVVDMTIYGWHPQD